MNKVNVNMTPCNDVVTLHCSQGDTEARKFYVKLHNNGEKIDSSSITDQMVFKAYEGGTEEILPTNGSTPTTSPIIADIKYPQGLLTDQEFLYRQSPTEEDGYAKIETIYGNTLVWNQPVREISSTYWERGSSVASFSATNGEGKFTASARYGYCTLKETYRFAIPVGHKVLLSIDIKASSGARIHFGYGNPGNMASTGVSKKVDGTGVYGTYTVLGTWSGTYNNYSVIVMDETTSDWSEIAFKNVNLFDLTAMFGSGNEPTIEEFKSFFNLPYYAYGQYLLNFNGTGIKTVGKNLWNNSIASVTSQLTKTDSGAVFDVFSSGAEILNFAIQDYGRPPFSDIDYTISFYAYADISGTSVRFDGQPDALYNAYSVNALGKDKQLALSTTRTRYTYSGIVLEGNTGFRFFRTTSDVNSSTSKVYIEDIQLEFGSIATDYEPYISSTLSLPISTYFPTGMKSAGSVYDELTPTKATTRIGVVDLGSMSWTAITVNNITRMRSYDIKTTIKYPALNNTKVNAICSKYDIETANNTYIGTEGFSCQNNGDIYVYDSAYTDATTFKSAMSGVYLNYELATPIENYGIVDLGSLTWYSEGTNTSGIVRMGSTGIRDFVKKPTSGSITANIVCDAYLTETADRTYLKNKGISINTGGTICVYDPNYNTSDKIASFKSAMSGVYLLYEKANPQSLTTASIVTKKGEIALAPQDEYLVGECYSNISENAGFLEAKVKLTDEDGDLYSTKIQIHVERKP